MRNKDMSLLKMSNLTESLSKKYRLNESYSTNGITLDKMKSDIQKAKNKLKKQKPRENFGMKEVRKIEDKYSPLQLDYYSDYSKLINDFIDWCETYTFNESYTYDTFEYGKFLHRRNQVSEVISSTVDKNGEELHVGDRILVDSPPGYCDREATIDTIYINKDDHPMVKISYDGFNSLTDKTRVSPKSCTLLTKNTKTVNEDYGEDKYSLVGQDGNAFALMGYTSRCMKECGLRDEVDEMIDRATESNYDNLIMVCDEYVQKCNDIARSRFEESLNTNKVVGKTWKEFVDNVENETEYAVDAAYKNHPEAWISLIDDKDNMYDAEVTQYHDGGYELMLYNVTPQR